LEVLGVEEVMPRFYMNIRHGEELVQDREGEEFSTLDKARSEAVLCARELTAERVPSGKKPRESRFEIVDDSGHTVLIVPFGEAVNG
jgi:hypothetical protein